MKENSSALYSEYIIDGIRMDSTPAGMLMECMTSDSDEPSSGHTAAGTVIDETKDPVPGAAGHDGSETETYLRKVIDLRRKADAAGGRDFRLSCPDFHTRLRIASSLIDTLWRKGHFRLENMMLSAEWDWDQTRIGNMAAFYFSAEAASGYLFDLGIRLDSYTFEKTSGSSDVNVDISVDSIKDEDTENDYDFFNEQDSKELRYCWISDECKCSDKVLASPSSWLIYIPFDTCEYRLGDSLFERVAGISGDNAPEIQDPDYFIDCFEVVRELMEDGVIMAGTAVGAGGLATAVKTICGDGTGICIDISGIERATNETDALRILFAEIPGVLIQIQDSDYDYVDSQMLLQDIAYFPLGHPSETGEINFTHGRKGVSDILASLLQGNIPEDDQDA